MSPRLVDSLRAFVVYGFIFAIVGGMYALAAFMANPDRQPFTYYPAASPELFERVCRQASADPESDPVAVLPRHE